MGAAVSFPPPRRPARQHGFTLVELLVSIAIGLVVMVALIAVYLNVSRTNSEMGRTNSMVENGRFAIDVLNDDVSHAGFWGGYVPQFDNFALRSNTGPGPVPGDVPTAAALAVGPCNAYASWDAPYRYMLLGIPVEVYQDAAPTGCDTTNLIKDRMPGTDVLVVRHTETCIPSDLAGGSPNCEASNASKVYFQRSYCATESPTTPFLLQTGPIANFTLHNRDCTTIAPIYKFDSSIYYVRSWSTTAGDGIPTLVRTRFNLDSSSLPAHEVPAQALIEGVEKFHVELGIDSQQGRCAPAGNDYTVGLSNVTGGNLVDPATCTFNSGTISENTLPLVRGDGVPESYVYCPSTGCTATQLEDAVAVKLYVVARSRDVSPGYTDAKTYDLGHGGTYTPTGSDQRYKRHLFTTAVRLVNVSGRRETP